MKVVNIRQKRRNRLTHESGSLATIYLVTQTNVRIRSDQTTVRCCACGPTASLKYFFLFSFLITFLLFVFL
jgi:hypothetical protein